MMITPAKLAKLVGTPELPETGFVTRHFARVHPRDVFGDKFGLTKTGKPAPYVLARREVRNMGRGI